MRTLDRALTVPASVFSVVLVTLSFAACGAESDDDTSSGVTEAATSAADASSGEEASSSATGAEGGLLDLGTGTTGQPTGAEYGACETIVDCPEGMLYACVTKITEGSVCAIGCMEHADCPPPPEGGSTAAACIEVDGRKRCVMAGCAADSDCPPDMMCHIEGPNWCHWPFN